MSFAAAAARIRSVAAAGTIGGDPSTAAHRRHARAAARCSAGVSIGQPVCLSAHNRPSGRSRSRRHGPDDSPRARSHAMPLIATPHRARGRARARCRIALTSKTACGPASPASMSGSRPSHGVSSASTRICHRRRQSRPDSRCRTFSGTARVAIVTNRPVARSRCRSPPRGEYRSNTICMCVASMVQAERLRKPAARCEKAAETSYTLSLSCCAF